MTQKKNLGRGLSTLLGDDTTTKPETSAASELSPQTLPIDRIKPGRFQPRRTFNEASLEELAQSIASHGILQPILVRKRDRHVYEIIAGERRWRAAQKAGLHDVPVVVKQLDNSDGYEVALLENVQRQDLSPIEEARGYRKLLTDFSYRQEDLARVIGKSRVHIANMIRLLNLPDAVLDMIEAGDLSPGHGRALLMAQEPGPLAERVVQEGLTVREAERLAKAGPDEQEPRQAKAKPEKSADIRALERDLSEGLGLAVEVAETGPERGRLIIRYASLSQLDRVLERLRSD